MPSSFGNSIVVRRTGVEEGPHRDTPRISGSHEPCVKVVGERTGRLRALGGLPRTWETELAYSGETNAGRFGSNV